MPEAAPRIWRARDFMMGSEELAQRLLGSTLVRELDDGQLLRALIVETEAYLGVKDRASHSFGARRTARNESMYSRGGHAYVYFTYGMHWCFNVVAGEVDDPIAVLVRAAEPLRGVTTMRALRGWPSAPIDTDGTGEQACDRPGRQFGKDRDRRLQNSALCRGPANLCKALQIDRALDGWDLTRGQRLWIESEPAHAPHAPQSRADVPRVRCSARIGVEYAGAWARRRLRWFIAGHASVSHARRREP